MATFSNMILMCIFSVSSAQMVQGRSTESSPCRRDANLINFWTQDLQIVQMKVTANKNNLFYIFIMSHNWSAKAAEWQKNMNILSINTLNPVLTVKCVWNIYINCYLLLIVQTFALTNFKFGLYYPLIIYILLVLLVVLV